MRHHHKSAPRLSVLALALLAGTSAQAACPTVNAQLAMEANDLVSTKSIYDDVAVNAECSNDLRVEMRKKLAQLYRAQPGDRVANLTEAVRLDKHWEIQAELGRAYFESADYGEAADYLQRAINRLNDNPSEGSIAEAEVEELLQLASTAVGLADGPVDIPLARNGNVGGIMSPFVRGFKVKEVDIHVTFEYDSDVFTEDGESIARKLADSLVDQASGNITLVGHTDPQGADEYNMSLSQRRAEAMRDYILASGFAGEVNIVAKGETEPPELQANLNLTEEQVFKLSRRVELLR